MGAQFSAPVAPQSDGHSTLRGKGMPMIRGGAVVEHYSDHPHLLGEARHDMPRDLIAGSDEAVRTAVAWVSGMTDRYACRQAMALLGWDRDRLPVGIDV